MSRRMLSRRSASVMNGSAVVWVDGASSGQARPRAGGSRGDRGGGADQTLVLCWPLLAHHTDRTIEASGGARLRTDDRGKSGRGSVAIGVKETDDGSHRAHRPDHARLRRTKVAGYQQDDVVVVDVVVQTGDPRLIGRTRMSDRRERQDCPQSDQEQRAGAASSPEPLLSLPPRTKGLDGTVALVHRTNGQCQMTART